MKYNKLGLSSLQVSEIGFGCMSLPAANQDAISLLHRAIDGGINYFDTADVYAAGANEIVVGKALKPYRDKIILATKVGNVSKKDGSPGFDWNPSKKHILTSIDESLSRLQTDYIDLYQLHGGTMEDNIEETIDTFEMLKKQGKIREYGISSIRPNVIHEYVRKSSIVSVMMQYSLLDRRPEEACLELLQQHRISVVARGALAQGLLAGKPARPYLELNRDQVSTAAAASNALTAIQYVLHHPVVASAIIGIRTEAHLEQALAATSAEKLTNLTVDRLRSTVHPLIYTSHRD